MNITKKLLAELHAPEVNVRLHSAKQIEEFKRSISMFGQIRPVVVDEYGTILAGNGLCEALKSMGKAEVDCYVVAGLTDGQKKKLMLTDNRIFSLGIDDIQAFDAIVAELKGDYDIPGYDEDLLKTLASDVEEADEIISGYGIISNESKESMAKAAERYEQEEKEFVQEAHEYIPKPIASAPIASAQPANIAAPQEYGDNQSAPEPLQRRFLVCPKCGEKIWL